MSTETQRTKGKWKVLHYEENEGDKVRNRIAITNELGSTAICFLPESYPPTEANAKYICLAVNHFERMKAYIKEMAFRYGRDEWIAGEANLILDSIAAATTQQ